MADRWDDLRRWSDPTRCPNCLRTSATVAEDERHDAEDEPCGDDHWCAAFCWKRLYGADCWVERIDTRADVAALLSERDTLRAALTTAERALRDQPMQAFKTPEAQHRRAVAITEARAALSEETP